MPFQKFFARFRLHHSRYPNTRKGGPFRLLPPSRDEAIRLAIKRSEDAANKHKWKAAVDIIDEEINNGRNSNKLLLQKAFLLSQDHKFKQSHAILKKLSKDKEDKNSSEAALKALKTSQLIQSQILDSRRILASELHSIAARYNRKLINLAEPDKLDWETDIVQVTIEESSKARNEYIPKLSIELLDQAINAGLQSPKFLHEKALTLCAIGCFEDAEKIWKQIANLKNNEKLSNSAKERLQTLDAKKENYLSNRTKLFNKRIQSHAKDYHWEIQHLPNPQSENSNVKTKQLAIEEAKAAFESGEFNLCLHILDASLDCFLNNRQALLLKGETLARLNRIEEAFYAWKELIKTKDDKYHRKALAHITSQIAKEAMSKSEDDTCKSALTFFIEEHLKLDLNPKYSNEIDNILTEIIGNEDLLAESSLKEHQLKLAFNENLITYLEEKLHRDTQNNLNGSSE